MIRLRDLVAKVRLVFDKASGTQTEGEATSTFDKIAGSAKKLAIAMAAAFALDKIKDWGVALVREASEADKVWNRLNGTLERAGVQVAAVSGQINGAARAMQDATTVGDEEFAATLNELITITGDYQGSLRNVGVVADFAAAKQIDLDTAAKLVGKAMIGETDTLKRYGVVVEEGADAVEQLRRQFAGAAEVEANTFGGKMTQLGNEFGDFKEQLGGILIDFIEWTGIIDALTWTLKGAARVIAFLRGESVGSTSGLSEEEAEKVRAHFGIKTETEIAAEERAAEKAAAAAKRAAEERARQAREVAKAAKEADDALREMTTGAADGVMRGGGDELHTGPAIIIRQITDELLPAVETATGAFQSMFRLITLDGNTAKETLTQIGVALALDGAGGIRQLAKAKYRANIAESVENAARALSAWAGGNPVSAAVYGKAAAEHLGAAALWRALGGAAGGGGGGSSRGGFVPTGRDNGGGAIAARSEVRSETHIWLDPFDPARPAIIRGVYAANQTGRELFGDNAKVNVHTLSSGRPR